MKLSVPQRDLLWNVAQHKYGWTHASRYGGQLQVADALVRRGLVTYGGHDRNHSSPTIVATDEGRAEIERRWPVSPFVLGTYSHQPGGWTPPEGRDGLLDRPKWKLTINAQSIDVPGDYVLVRRDVFERIANAFDYINRVLIKYGPDPRRKRQRPLIFARVEAGDASHTVRQMVDSEGTTEIYTVRR